MAVRQHVSIHDVTKRYVRVACGKKADGSSAMKSIQMLFVNESGLYSLIFGSKLESALRFKHWVTSALLPAICKERLLPHQPGETAEQNQGQSREHDEFTTQVVVNLRQQLGMKENGTRNMLNTWVARGYVVRVNAVVLVGGKEGTGKVVNGNGVNESGNSGNGNSGNSFGKLQYKNFNV